MSKTHHKFHTPEEKLPHLIFQVGYLKEGCIWRYFEKSKKTIGKNEQRYCVNQKKQHLQLYL